MLTILISMNFFGVHAYFVQIHETEN